MPFGTITANTKTYEPRQSGVYSLSTVAFGSPANEFRLRGASLRKDGSVSCSATRVLEKDVTVGADSIRKSGTVSLTITLPKDGVITTAELDGLISDLSEFLTAGTISRMLQGEQ